MPIAHLMTYGMSGIRAAGDVVAKMQFSKNMKVGQAKGHVANKLGVTSADLSDEYVMREIREEHGIGVITSVAVTPKGYAAKINIEKLLDIKINCCEMIRNQLR